MEIIVWSSVLLYAGIYTAANVKERISNVFKLKYIKDKDCNITVFFCRIIYKNKGYSY